MMQIGFSGMNIHRIRCNREKISNLETCKKYISEIMSQQSGKSQLNFNKRKVVAWKPEEHLKFRIRLYYAKSPTISGFAQWMTHATDAKEDDFFGAVVHTVCFLYRQLEIDQENQQIKYLWEIFCLTQGDGWRAVKNQADFRFPLRIAAKLIRPKFAFTENRSLVGDKGSAQNTYRQEYSLEQHEEDSMWQVCKVFQSCFKEGTSLYNPKYQLTAFVKFDLKGGVEKTFNRNVKVGSGKILITGKMTMREHEEILNHFSLVDQGLSCRIDKEGNSVLEEPDPSWRYFENIQPVKSALIPKLSQAVLQILWECYEKKERGTHFSFVHRYYRDFYASNEFTLSVCGKRYSWFSHPSLDEVFRIFKWTAGPFSDFKEFCGKIGQARLKFSERKGAFPLSEFFQGEIRHQGTAYFLIDGTWLKVDGNHIAVIQRAFRKLLKKHLIEGNQHPAALSEPWFTNEKWVTFRLTEMEEATGLRKIKLSQSLKRLESEQFSFIDSENRVCCPYPTQCLLEDSDCKPIKSLLRKNWEILGEILASQEQVSEESFNVLFKEKSRSENHAEVLLKILKKKRPILVKRLLKQSKKFAAKEIKSAFDSQGIAVITELSQYVFGKLKTADDYKQEIEECLKNSHTNKEPVTAVSLRERVNHRVTGKRKIRENQAIAVFKALQSLQPIVSEAGDPHLYSIQGPLPEDLESKIREFLERQHRNYRLILPEEGYNRLYLDKGGFLVFDQVYPGVGEQVELFDILKYDPLNPGEGLYLYHVKEGFGQKTRDACSQIRVSAGLLRNTLNRDCQTLHRLYSQATGEAVVTPFRKKLKEKLQQIVPTPPGDMTASDQFVSIFTQANENKKIWFVYAFIDEAKVERRLELEKEPKLEVDLQDLSIFKEKEEILAQLKKYELLDGYNQLTDNFFRLNKEQFIEKMKIFEKREEVYDCIYRKISQFDSLIAKVELLHLRSYLRDLGFGFKIFQISRNKNEAREKEAVKLNDELTPAEWDSIAPDLSKEFEYDQKEYVYAEKKYSEQQLIAYLLGDERLNKREVRKKLYHLFSQKPAQFTRQDIAKILEKDFHFTERELENVAICLGYKITILDENFQDLKEELNPSGSKDLVVVQCRRKFLIASLKVEDTKAVATSIGDTKRSPSSYSESISEELQQEILSRSPPDQVGMVNESADCFFNAAIQLVLHSPLREFFLNCANLEKDQSGVIKENSQQFYNFFKNLCLDYYFGGTGNEATSYSKREMRRILRLDRTGQQDAEQAITAMFGFYNLSEIESEISHTTKRFSLQQISSNPEGIEEQLRGPFDNDSPPDNQRLTFFNLTPNKDEDFQEAIDNQLLHVEELEGPLDPVEINGCKYQPTRVERHPIVTELKENLYFQIKRYAIDHNKKEAQTQKLKHPLSFSDDLTIHIGDKYFELQGFIYHKGNSVQSGHYFTFCRTSNGWMKYNDRSVEECKSISEYAKKAYILHFRKKEMEEIA